MRTSFIDGGSQDPRDHRLVTEAGMQAIYDRLSKFQRGTGRAVVILSAEWKGYARWARNAVSLAADERNIRVQVIRQNERGTGMADTNQIDDVSLAAVMHAAERKMQYADQESDTEYDGLRWTPPLLPAPDTRIWSDATYTVTPEQRGVLVRALTEEARTRQFSSAGFLLMRVGEKWVFGPPSVASARERLTKDVVRGQGSGRQAREIGYVRHTEAQCSMTVRHPKGVGSGWAGLSGYDWSVIDAKTLAQRALAKCEASLNPVAIEPGRYTVILEPQAVAAFSNVLGGVGLASRSQNESGAGGPFTLDKDPETGLILTRLGQKVVDERISITHDPMDRQLGVIPALGLRPQTWIDRGVLQTLGYGRDSAPTEYALGWLNENLPALWPNGYRMSGGTTSIEEMIATTKRGIVVTRFWNVGVLSPQTLMMTGTTRDGLWLVENGKITKAIKNMRFTDSPLFVFNQVQQLGIPVPVFNPSDDSLSPVIVPPIKANDFAFTSMIDAV